MGHSWSYRSHLHGFKGNLVYVGCSRLVKATQRDHISNRPFFKVQILKHLQVQEAPSVFLNLSSVLSSMLPVRRGDPRTEPFFLLCFIIEIVSFGSYSITFITQRNRCLQEHAALTVETVLPFLCFPCNLAKVILPAFKYVIQLAEKCM